VTSFDPVNAPRDVVDADVGLVDWLRVIADQNVPEVLRSHAAVPVAWLGRTSTDDQQDPTLSLPRQLENSRSSLPDGFVIVAKFYDVESGRTALENRGMSSAHEQFDIPIPRDGGIADLLAEAQRPDRRFVAVICESIERIARITYFSTKIEYELEQAGVPLLAADEGVDRSAIPGLTNGGTPYRKATPTLTRRIKQAISEWYVLNMLELSWGGFKEHTAQGFNIGKPPYGYIGQEVRLEIRGKAREGRRVKHRLVPDPLCGPTVTQIFTWRAMDRLGYGDIADRLNLDPERYPPPEPIAGKGRRRIGAWTASNVREVLDNPKHTGYMVWNRRKNPRKERNVKGRVNPPSAWECSPAPTHEPLVTRAMFAAASTTGRFRRGSRSGAGMNTHPATERTYLLRSYLRCDLCSRRTYGSTRRGNVYYRCTPNAKNHSHLPWFPDHPAYVLVREDLLLDPLADFFAQRVFGAGRKRLLAASVGEAVIEPGLESQKAQLAHELGELRRAQDNLINELANLTPSGDTDVDNAWRAGIQRRFAAVVAEHRTKAQMLDALTRDAQHQAPVNLDLLDILPQEQIDLTRMPEPEQRRLYDAFHLDLRYHATRKEVTIRVTITGETAPLLASAARAALGQQPAGEGCGPTRPTIPAPRDAVADALGAPGMIRTCAVVVDDLEIGDEAVLHVRGPR
jgi:hypothetical protein